MLAVGPVQAGISGRFETLIEQDNRYFQRETGIEERLDLTYDDPTSGLRSGVSLALSQWQGEWDKELAQLYLEKTWRDMGSQLSLGRLQRSDALGFYTLDGLLFKQVLNRSTLTWYGGVPGRIEAFHSIEGEALYGFDVQTSIPQLAGYTLDARVGWQHLKQQHTVNRLNIGGRGVQQQKAASYLPSVFSLSGSYLVDDQIWENVQLSMYGDFENNRLPARLRADYETYQSGEGELTFKDRFYALYARGRQSQIKIGYQIKQNRQQSWSLSGRKVMREFGGNGYGAVATMDYDSKQGWQLTTQLDRLALADECVTGFYLEAKKSFSSLLRGSLSGVLQQQQKQRLGDNLSIGLAVQLEQRAKFKIFPSAFWFSAHASYIQNSRLPDEYRIAVRMSYSFDDRMQASFQ